MQFSAWRDKKIRMKNKTARIRAKPWMFRLPIKVYGAVISLKKLKVIKQNEIFFFKNFKFFYKNHPPTRHIKYKRIDFATGNKSIMANKLR